MVITFATVEEAVAAPNKPVRLYGRIGGVAVDIWEARTSHGVDQPIGTCSVVLGLPRPASLAINAEIEIEAGYAGATRRIFHGRIPDDDGSIDDSGPFLRVNGTGWASLLAYDNATDLTFDGPISLADLFRGLCAYRSVPAYFADDTTDINGNTILLGGNSNINNGRVVIAKDTSPLNYLARAAESFGYRVFDCPDGSVCLKRVSGLPSTSSTNIAEGVNAYQFGERRDSRPMVTYWEVLGVRYTDDDGGITQIRSIPATVPFAAELDPPGYRKARWSDSENLVTDTLALQCRNALEVDRSTLYTITNWESTGNPIAHPGDVVSVNSTSLELTDELQWLMRIDQDIDDRSGYSMRAEGWSGGGQALPAGDDCVTEDVGVSDAYHLGNQTISWYRDPTADGTEITIPITVSFNDYSSLRLTGIAHGTNTFGTGNVANATTGSQVEVWQLDDPTQPESGTNELTRKGTLELPTLDEEYARQRNYASSDQFWTAFSLPLPGTLHVGAAELRLIAGTNPDGFDDYEVTDLALTYCGVGEPTLPSEGSA